MLDVPSNSAIQHDSSELVELIDRNRGQTPPPYSQGEYTRGSVNVQQPARQPVNTDVQTVIVGGCPLCRIGILREEFTVCGICWLICCFPLGLICFLTLKDKRCTNCRRTFE